MDIAPQFAKLIVNKDLICNLIPSRVYFIVVLEESAMLLLSLLYSLYQIAQVDFEAFPVRVGAATLLHARNIYIYYKQIILQLYHRCSVPCAPLLISSGASRGAIAAVPHCFASPLIAFPRAISSFASRPCFCQDPIRGIWRRYNDMPT
jgi:hypothetical protein